jgi:hypothetical protein
MNNGNRDFSKTTAFLDPASKLFSLYEPGEKPGTLTAAKDKDGKPMRVDRQFVQSHKISERTEP